MIAGSNNAGEWDERCGDYAAEVKGPKPSITSSPKRYQLS